MDLKTLSKYSSLGYSTLRRYVSRKELPHFNTGGRILVKKEDFDQWMIRFKVESETQQSAQEILKTLK